MIEAMAYLWKLPPPGPEDIYSDPAFIQLREVCWGGSTGSAKIGAEYALLTALRSLGMPCLSRRSAEQFACSVEEAAKRLDSSFRATRTRRLHIAPLDLADDLPNLEFGPARLRRFSSKELFELFDEARLVRFFSDLSFEADRFSQFHWLVVEEFVEVCGPPEARALPVLFNDLSQDFGRIEPHSRRFPKTFEAALFFLLLSHWEDWATLREVDWRGFRVPWVYTVDHDIFVRPDRPQSAASLSWEPHFYDDFRGNVVEVERPVSLVLEDAAKVELSDLNDERWAMVEQATSTVLFETPIVHFLIRAFVTDGIDEFLAHITTIEAALGLQADYQRARTNHTKLGATQRMSGRIAGLLGDRQYAEQYSQLFDLRSAFLHGRSMRAISTDERIMARSLARKVVARLIFGDWDKPLVNREAFLNEILDKGVEMN